MNRVTRISIAVFTFVIGLTGVRLAGEGAGGVGAPAAGRTAATVVPVAAPQPERFKPTLRGCGMGYGQVYEMPDGRAMSEGSACSETAREARREWRKLLAGAAKILERVPRHKNRSGDRGERVVALFPPDGHAGGTARILWYDGGDCYLYISAPTLDIALEFEQSNAYAY